LDFTKKIKEMVDVAKPDDAVPVAILKELLKTYKVFD
jgi:hypothetical protein